MIIMTLECFASTPFETTRSIKKHYIITRKISFYDVKKKISFAGIMFANIIPCWQSNHPYNKRQWKGIEADNQYHYIRYILKYINKYISCVGIMV